MIYRFIDEHGTFEVADPQKYGFYLPLTDSAGRLLSSIGPNLAGDIKRDNEHFLTPPASVEDLRANLLCRREFFIKAGKRFLRLSQPSRDKLEAGFLYQKLFKRYPGMAVEILNFIPSDLPVEVMRVTVTNRSSAPVPVTAFSFVPLFGRPEKNLRDHRHVSSLLNRVFLQKFGIVLRPTMVFDEKGHRENRMNYFTFGYEGERTPPQGQFPTLDSFWGGDIFHPEAVEKDLPGVVQKLREHDGKEACAGFRFGRKPLAPGASRVYVLLMGISDTETDAARLFRALDRPAKVEAAFRKTREYWQAYLSRLQFDFKDKNSNGWHAWVTLQPQLRKLFGCSFLPHFDYGKGGRGWRDLWQDALALLLSDPDQAGEIIRQSFRGVRVDGSNATIITGDGNFIADRNRIDRVWMDHGVWPYLTARLYVNRTGDAGFLLTDQTYFRDHQLRRARGVDRAFHGKDFLLRDTQGRVYRGSILEHILVQTLVQFFNVGKHNVTRLENADWNDGLDMAAAHGESVAFSFMYCHNLRDIVRLLEVLKAGRRTISLMKELALLLDRTGSAPVDYADPRKKQARLERYFDATQRLSGEKAEVDIDKLIADLRQKWEQWSSWLSRKEWLPQEFFNGYYDNQGRRVEGIFRQSPNQKDGSGRACARMTLPAQVFAIMSGVATEKQVAALWRSLNRYLRDPRLKGFRLNTDFGAPQMELGRAFGFSYGDKENGAFFSHMSVMLANALYSRGFLKEGRQVFESIRQMAMSELSGLPPVLPEYFNAQGKGLYPYLTGSASWYIYTLTQEIFGIKFLLGDLLLQPKLFSSDIKKGVLDARVSFNGSKLHLRYLLAGRAKSRPVGNRLLEAVKVLVNGRVIRRGADGFLVRNTLLSDGINPITILLE
jgi:cellobiose phosphorylase